MVEPLIDPSFEAQSSAWTLSGPAAISFNTGGNALYGVTCVSASANYTGFPHPVEHDSGVSQTFTVPLNTNLTPGAWVQSTGGIAGHTVNLIVDYGDGNGLQVVASLDLSKIATWTHLVAPNLAPTGAGVCTFEVSVQANGVGGTSTVFIDGCHTLAAQPPIAWWINPSNWLTKLPAIPNDGQDYQIIMESGTYITNAISSSVTIDHSLGGRLMFVPHASGPVTFTYDPTKSIGGMTLYTIAPYISFGNVKMVYEPYVSTTNLGYNAIFYFGCYNGVSRKCLCTFIDLHDIVISGSDPQIFAAPSGVPTLYTNVYFRNITCTDLPRNGSIASIPDGTSNVIYAHIYYDNVISDCTNGPDGNAWGGPSVSSHTNGTAQVVGPSGLRGNSTFNVTRCDLISRMRGSMNHDLHCFQLTNGNNTDATIRYSLKDCRFLGRWEAGHAELNGGGNLWVGYYHPGGPDFPTEGSRPRLDFENCYFDIYIDPGVLEHPGDAGLGPGNPPRYIFFAASSADYHFWDCQFNYSSLPAVFQNGFVWDVAAGATDVSIWFHSTTRAAVPLGDPVNGLGPTVKVYTDSQTRLGPGSAGPQTKWGRVPTLPAL